MPLQSTSGAATYDAFGVSAVSAAVQAEAIDFDGTSDFLEKTSDLTGNADGQSFTFSFWLWLNDTAGAVLTNGNSRLVVQVTSGAIQIYGKNTGDNNVLNFTTAVIPQQTWTHVLVSLNLSNTAQRHVYINDVQQSITWTTYTATNVDRASTGTWYVMGPGLTTRASNLFMDYTYRDLSITANRRLFVTADLKPALGQAALNPILYLPMSDPTAPGVNTGTGGNFTLTGVVARSGRGPNQYNAPYSDLDGSADWLSRTSITGIADGKQITFHCCLNCDSVSGRVLDISDNSSAGLQVEINTSNKLRIQGWNPATSQRLSYTSTTTFVVGRNYVITFSIDLASVSSRGVYINGALDTGTYATYINDVIDLTMATNAIGRTAWTASNYFNGRLGAVWFNTSYIDLSVPANLAKFVTGTGINAAPVDLGATGELPTGTSPLIYLPMYGNNAGRNYGTGGDFTVNSGPYTGARGPNEFWGNIAALNGGGTLRRTTALSVANSNKFSLVFYIYPSTNLNQTVFTTQTSGGTVRFRLLRGEANDISITGSDSAGTQLLSATAGSGWSASAQFIFVCVDLSDSAKRFMYTNNSALTLTWSTYTNGNINFAADRSSINGQWNGSSYTLVGDGVMSQFYFATEYIDFSQEANRLKFRDAFGNPVNLTQQIEAGAIPNPAIYMRFPPTSFGTNSGTGGDYSTFGSITDGGQL
jgi:hypothetical protein